MVKTFILAAGEGTRLHPLKLDVPKPMVPINGIPLLEVTINQLRQQDFRELIINLHHRPEVITNHFDSGQRFGVNITYSHEDELLGTAGAIKHVEPLLDDTFFVVYGDVLTDLDYRRLLDFHRQKKAIVTLSLYQVDNPTQVGLVETDQDNRVAAFVEKPAADQVFTDLANAGILVCEPDILGLIPPDAFYDFGHDLLPSLLNLGYPMYGLPIKDSTLLIDIGTPEKYKRAQMEWPGRHT